ncbi:MAG: VWA domain-containing protein [Polyangiaceae bacterium]|nr:VWA domain-containing protein [Polyangiaceae bacterium]
MRQTHKMWIYVAALSSVFFFLATGQLSCARADVLAKHSPRHRDVKAHDPKPWQHTTPAVNTPGVSLRAQLDRGAVLQNSAGVVRVEVNVATGPETDGIVARASDIVVVIDTSGSMKGEKLRFAKQATFELISRLGDQDRFGLVEYSDHGTVVVPLQHASEPNRRSWRREVQRLRARASTNISEGIDVGGSLLERVSRDQRPGRLILLSDGLATAGDTSVTGLSRRAHNLASNNFALTTMGIGSGFDENVMTSLATAGTGAFYYLAKLSYLPEFFEGELASARGTYARSAELRFEPAQGVQLLGAMGLPVHRDGLTSVVRLGGLYAARSRTVWLTLRVPTYSLGDKALGSLSLNYLRHGRSNLVAVGALPRVACLSDELRYQEKIHRSIWERAVLDDVFNRTEEAFGDAIRSGNRQELRVAMRRAEDEKRLAQSIGSERVLRKLSALKKEAAHAEVAQRAPAAVRNKAAKKSKSRAYQQRNASSYHDSAGAMRSY